jgi:hypothetical protein
LQAVESQKYLYRIIRFEHLIRLFKDKELYLTHPSAWEDPYETKFNHKSFSFLAAQCWCRHAVSDAMWRIYSPNKLGVRIRTERYELKEAMERAWRKQCRYSWKLGDVLYKPQSEIDRRMEDLREEFKKKHDPYKAIAPLLWKRLAFIHEAETRLIVYDSKEQEPVTSMAVPIDPHSLIKSVLVDPRAPNEILSLYEHYLRKDWPAQI